MKHFIYYPKVEYSSEVVVNITVRSKIRDAVLKKTSIFYDYTLRDGDRPDIISQKYYGSPDHTWVIFYANEIFHPEKDWLMSYNRFQDFIIRKYGTIERSKSIINHYLLDGEYIIDKSTYEDNQIEFVRKSYVTAYDNEYNLNEAKRNIKILDVVHLRQITNDLKTIFT